MADQNTTTTTRFKTTRRDHRHGYYRWVSLLVIATSQLASARWGAPLVVGIQAYRQRSSPNRFRSLLATSTKISKTTSSTRQQATTITTNNNQELETQGRQDFAAVIGTQDDSTRYSSKDDAIITSMYYDEDEVRALFAPSDEGQPTYDDASRRSSENNNFDTRGFRNPLPLPAFLKSPQQKDEMIPYDEYEEITKVIPCAAAAAAAAATTSATRKKQASFTTTPGNREHKSRFNFRKNSRLLPRQSTSPPTIVSSTQAVLDKSNTLGSAGRPLLVWENMICGAVSRSVAQTIMHPANTMKTMLQQSNAPPLTSLLTLEKFPILFRGAGANFILSVPHGAVNFAVLEKVRKEMSRGIQRSPYWREREERIGPALDFLSSAISTVCCSVVSTPQMMITDNIMAGQYKNLPDAVRGLASRGRGLSGFYSNGWWPGLVGKIPSYALTWTFFQQLKVAQKNFSGREATNFENSVMGCLGSAATVCIMIPMDTVKTRLVTQSRATGVPYKGIIDCAVRISREEGIKSFYRGLPPRLVSVVPLIGIQFTIYESMKRIMQKRTIDANNKRQNELQLLKFKQQEEDDPYTRVTIGLEASMEAAASPEHPYPAPQFLRIVRKKKEGEKRQKK